MSNRLPIELWSFVFQFLSFEECYPKLLYVSKSFYRAVLDCKTLVLRLESSHSPSLQSILAKFTLSKVLEIQLPHGELHPMRNVHDFCLSFDGNNRIEEIYSVSECIVPGALKCKRLRKFVMLARDDGTFDDSFRNLNALLEMPQLEVLALSDAVYDQGSQMTSNIRDLELLSIPQSFLSSFLDDVMSQTLALPYLEHLSLNLDYLSLPMRMFEALGHCKRIKSLHLKYCKLVSGEFYHMLMYLPQLEILNLSNVEIPFMSQNWMHFLKIIATYLPHLKKLHLSNCKLEWSEHQPYNLALQQHVEHDLECLKLFDSDESKPDAPVLHFVIQCFKSLKSLRMDLEHNALPPIDAHYLKLIKRRFAHLSVLELRFASTEPMKRPVSKDLELQMPQLQVLKIWSPLEFPHLFLSQNTHLTVLHLIYIPEAPKCEFQLPFLKELKIMSLSSEAQEMCLDMLQKMVFTNRLRHLSLSAMSRTSKPLPVEALARIVHLAPELKQLQLDHFETQHTHFELLKGLSCLERLVLQGPKAVTDISREWENTSLFPLLHQVKTLSTVHLETNKIDIPGFELFTQKDIMRSLMAFGSFDPAMLAECAHYVQSANTSCYMSYSKQTKAKFSHLKDFRCIGPLSR